MISVKAIKGHRHQAGWASMKLSGILLFSMICLGAAQEPGVAPLNPDWTAFREDAARKNNLKITDEEHALGLIPPILDLSHLKTLKNGNALKTLKYAASFDLRSHGKLTAVRNQGAYGTCWAFATYGSMESCLLTAETNDFSENHLANLSGFDYGFNDGGFYGMSVAYLARWGGPVDEADDPYPDQGGSSANTLVRRHVQETLILSPRSSASDNDAIKEAVSTRGAVATTMYIDGSYYNSGNKAFYYSGANEANHAVAIVGWDDNFSATNFTAAPPGDGAFIIRNSWGPDWGDGGYFRISYHDSCVGEYNYVFDDAGPTNNYLHVYQYDPLGWVSSYGYGSTSAWGANVFQLTTTGTLEAVSFYAASPGSVCAIHVYANVTTNNPTAGDLMTSQTGTVAFAGYHTVTLDAPVTFLSETNFSIVVKFTTPGYNYPIPIEYKVSGYSSGATSSNSQSFVSGNGATWADLYFTPGVSNGNVCIKGFLKAGPQPPLPPSTISASGGTYTDKVRVTWSESSEASGYEVWRHTSDSPGGAAQVAHVQASTAYDDADATPGMPHYYWVKATNEFGAGAFSGSAQGWRALSPPSGMTASDGAYSNRVRIAWSSASGAEGYTVWRNTIESSGSAEKIGNPALTSFSDTNVVSGSRHYYWVKATSGVSVSAFSTSDSGWRGVPSPTGVSASDGEYTDKVRVEWGAVAGAESYDVWRNTGNDPGLAEKIHASASTVFDDSGAGLGILYYYWVKAAGGLGTSVLSASDSGWVGLSAPTGVSASDGEYTDKVRVEWNAAGGATGYKVWRGAGSDPEAALMIGEVASTSFSDTNAVLGTSYHYWVKAGNGIGSSEFGGPDSGWRGLLPPSGVSASDGKYTDKVRVEWNAADGAVEYELWKSSSDDIGASARVTSTVALYCNDESGVPGATYYYWVKAINTMGVSELGGPDSGWRALSPPSGMSACDGAYKDLVRVKWSSAVGAESYEVWRSSSVDSGSAELAGETSDVSYDDIPAAARVIYYYWVKSVCGERKSGFSASDSGWCGLHVTGDYDGDGRSDLAVYHEESGYWFFLPSSTLSLAYQCLGGPGWQPVPANYDGDLKYDAAVHRQSGEDWYLNFSGCGTLYHLQLGQEGYDPAPADYDADGKADLAVYDEGNGYWYVILSSSGELAIQKFGEAGYAPVQADYDGDGKTDLAVYQETTGYWYIQLSGNGYSMSGMKFGELGYAPVPADYDGDGKADPAVYQEATGYWFVLFSETASLRYMKFGESGYKPVPGDFDGDGKADSAVYHGETGYWFILYSSDSTLGYAPLGGPGYIPTVAGL